MWDVTDPARPQQWLIEMGEESNTVYVQLEDSSRQLDGVTYAWRVRVLDGADGVAVEQHVPLHCRSQRRPGTNSHLDRIPRQQLGRALARSVSPGRSP